MSLTVKKILVLTSTYPRREQDTDPPFVLELCTRLARENIQIDVLAPHAPGLQCHETIEGINIHRYRYFFERWELLAYDGGIMANLRKNRLLYLVIPFFILFQLKAIYRLMRKNNYELMHAHWIIPQGFTAALAKKFLPGNEVKLLCTSHGGDLFVFRKSLFSGLLSWTLNRTDGIAVVSTHMRDVCRGLVNGDKKIFIAPMGVDLERRFKPLESVERDARLLIFVGRLVEKKGTRILLDAFSRVLEKYPDLHLQIVGDGPEGDALEKQCERLGITKQVSFKGAVSQDTIPSLLSSATIAVMPSVIDSSNDQEGLGLVAIEAMGCGCAVIASSLKAVQDVVKDRDNGVLVPPGNALALADAIMNLLEDDTLRYTIMTRCRQSVIAKFDWSNVSQNYLNILNHLSDSGMPARAEKYRDNSGTNR